VDDGQEIGGLSSEDGIVNQALFTPDGSRVASACEDGTIRFRDALTGRPLPSMAKHPAAVNRLCFSPDGRKLLTTSGWLVRIFDASSGQAIAPALQHDSDVAGATFSPDSRLIATWSYYAKKVWPWDAATGEPLAPAIHHAGNVDGVAFHPDSLRLLIADETAARLWNFAEENRQFEGLDLFYRLLSSASIEESGNTAALDAETLNSTWIRLKANNGSELSTSQQARSAWYHERAALFEATRRWPFAIFYLKQLLKVESDGFGAQERLVRAESELEGVKR